MSTINKLQVLMREEKWIRGTNTGLKGDKNRGQGRAL